MAGPEIKLTLLFGFRKGRAAARSRNPPRLAPSWRPRDAASRSRDSRGRCCWQATWLPRLSGPGRQQPWWQSRL